MRIPLLFTLALLIVTSAEHASDEQLQNDGKEEKSLRSDQRHLQHFPYLKTADLPAQQAAEKPDGNASVVTIESALVTTTEEQGTNGENGSVNSKERSGTVSALRFNKFNMYENRVKPTLTAADYPLSEALARTLSYGSNAYSVVTSADYRMKGHDIEHYIEAVGGYPARPSKNPNSPYWRAFKIVVKRVRARQLGQLPPKSAFHPPRLWAKLNATEVAQAVHDEYPGHHQSKMIASFITSEEGLKIDHDIIPFRCREDFIGTDVMLAALNTWSITSKLSPYERVGLICGTLRRINLLVNLLCSCRSH